MVNGYVIVHKDGHGWVRRDGSLNKEGDILLPHHQMRTLIHGDFVLVQPSGTDKRGRKEGRLVRILEERNGQIVGRFFFEYGYSYMVPDDSRIHHDILIRNNLRAGARMGNVVVIEITDRGTRNRGMMGKVVEVLGENMAPGMKTQIAIRTHKIPMNGPKKLSSK